MFIILEGVVYSSLFLHAVGIPHFAVLCAETSIEVTLLMEITLLGSSVF